MLRIRCSFVPHFSPAYPSPSLLLVLPPFFPKSSLGSLFTSVSQSAIVAAYRKYILLPTLVAAVFFTKSFQNTSVAGDANFRIVFLHNVVVSVSATVGNLLLQTFH